MKRVPGYILYVTVKGQLVFFLVNAPPTPLDVAASNFAST